MLSEENVKTPCNECNGKGYTGTIKLEREQITNHKILCLKCIGLKELDWLQQITGINIVDDDNFSMIEWILEHMSKDNWVYYSRKTDAAYYILAESYNLPAPLKITKTIMQTSYGRKKWPFK